MALTLAEIAELKRLRDQARRKQSSSPASVAAAPIPVPVEPTGQSVETGAQLQARKGLPEGYVPSEAELLRYLGEWDTLVDYVDQENGLAMLFRGDETFAANTDMRHVIVKCAVLNDFYATNIFKIASVARKIVSIPGFDARLAAGDRNLVEEIAVVDNRRNYSFATKYCSHHKPELFPIYDRYVADVLHEMRRREPGNFRFRSKDALKDYMTFCEAIDDFSKAYGLEAYSYKEIDRYLWQLGKEYYNYYKQ